MDFRTSIIIAIGIFLFASYYLEKEMGREKVFWLFSGLSVLTGAASAYAVAKRHPYFDALITLTVIFIFMAIIYFEETAREKPRPEPQAQSQGSETKSGRKTGRKK